MPSGPMQSSRNLRTIHPSTVPVKIPEGYVAPWQVIVMGLSCLAAGYAIGYAYAAGNW